MSFHSHIGGSGAIRFSRSCPTCGRRIRLRTHQLGRQVACPHCLAEFQASIQDGDQPITGSGQADLGDSELMARVDSVLEQAAVEQAALRTTYPPMNASY